MLSRHTHSLRSLALHRITRCLLSTPRRIPHPILLSPSLICLIFACVSLLSVVWPSRRFILPFVYSRLSPSQYQTAQTLKISLRLSQQSLILIIRIILMVILVIIILLFLPFLDPPFSRLSFSVCRPRSHTYTDRIPLQFTISLAAT